MANFCGKRGSLIDQTTGLCPKCNADKATQFVGQSGGGGVNTPTQRAALVNNIGTAPATPAAQVAKANKKEAKSVTALSITIAVLLSVCLFITSVLAFAIYSVRNAVKKDNLQKISEDISYTDAFNEFGGKNSGLERFYGFVYNELDASIDDGNIDKIVRKTSINKFIVNKISKFCDDFFDDGGKMNIKKTEVKNLIYKNSDYINKQTGIDVNDEIRVDGGRSYEVVGDLIADWIIKDDEVTLFKTQDIENNNSVAYYLLKYGLSYIAFAIFVLLGAVVIFALIRNNYLQGICGAGIVFIIIGFLFTVVGLFSMIGSLWESITGGAFIAVLIGKVFEVNILTSVLLLLIGVLLLVVRFLIKKYIVDRKKAKANNT